MGKLGGFLQIERRGIPNRDPEERRHDVKEFVVRRSPEELADQGARCMECGVPFCHNGCPLGNLIPDWNDHVYRDRWDDASRDLHATNNFPEFTGRLCPAPCESACVLEIREGEAVTIKQLEYSIAERAWEEGYLPPRPPRTETGFKVAVVGSGPAGMAAAQQLRRSGHAVTLFERDEAPGGLVRFGVPDFKIEKQVIERRIEQLVAEGVRLRCGVEVGRDISQDQLRQEFDAVVLAIGSRVPRDLPVPGRELDGVHFAMDYLYERNRAIAAEFGPLPQAIPPAPNGISAAGKRVVVIGGGDTGADCVGNSIREGATQVVQLELLPEPPEQRPDDRTPWPLWPQKFRLSYAMEEAQSAELGEQDFSVTTVAFEGGDGQVTGLRCAQAESAPPFGPVEDSEFLIEADLVLLAMGFLHPEPELLEGLGCETDRRGNIKAGTYATSVPGVFAAGDARRGQSLIVWAINEGRQCARMVDRHQHPRARRQPMFPDRFRAGQNQGSRAIVDPRRIASGNRLVRTIHRLELGQRFGSRLRTQMFVLLDDSVTLATLDNDRHDFFSEKSGFLRRAGALLAAQREGVLVFAGDLVVHSDVIGGLRHGIHTVLLFHQRIDEAPADGGVLKFLATTESRICLTHDIGGAGHGFDAACESQLHLAASDSAEGRAHSIHA